MYAGKKREKILKKIRSVTERTVQYRDKDFFQLVEKHKASDSARLRSFADSTEEFSRQATAAGSTVIALNAMVDIPGWLQNMGLNRTSISLSPQLEIRNLDWSNFQLVEGSEATACIGVVKASLAAAETGSILQYSHTVSTGLLFLVDRLVVVLNRSDIRPRYEDLWAELEPLAKGTEMPRAVHIISGPSRTADVEQMIQIGAHGPREVYILLVS